MLQECNARSVRVNLKINASKTKVIQNFSMFKGNLWIDDVDFKKVYSYIYLGQEMNTCDNHQSQIARR